MIDIHRRTGYLLATVIVVQILLISVQVTSSSGAPLIQTVTFGLLSRAQIGLSGGLTSLRDGWTGYFALQDVSKDNVRLRQEIASLKVRVQEQGAMVRRNESLRDLLAMDRTVSLSTVAAEVIAGDVTPWFRTLTIGRGAADGIQLDAAVIAPDGVVGRVVGQPAQGAAKVQLIIDRNAAIGGMVERTGVPGILNGVEGNPQPFVDRSLPLNMKYVSNLSDVQVGDRVVTSSIEGIYPKGFLIGYIERVQQGPNLYQEIQVRPTVDFNALDHVLVVMEPPRMQELGEPSQ